MSTVSILIRHRITCWQEDPNKRPDLKQVCEELNSLDVHYRSNSNLADKAVIASISSESIMGSLAQGGGPLNIKDIPVKDASVENEYDKLPDTAP
jgi:hypothetical protein